MTHNSISHSHAPAATWKLVDAELSVGLPNGPLNKFSAIAMLLVPEERRSSVVLQYIVGLPVEAEPALTVAERLNAALATIIPAWSRSEPSKRPDRWAGPSDILDPQDTGSSKSVAVPDDTPGRRR